MVGLHQGSVLSSLLFAAVMDLSLTQHVKYHSRDDAVLDLILSFEPGMIENLYVRERFGEGFKNIVIIELLHLI